MSAAKSGNHIYVSGTGNTLASITTDINDTTFIEKTSTSPDIYTVKGNVARYLRIRNGGTLTIGDSTDYSVNETLEFENDVANRLRFYVDAGGKLEQYGDTTIDFFTGTQRIYYVYFYGALYIRGNATYTPVWQNYQRLYFYENQNNDTYTDDIWDIDGLIIGSAAANNYYAIYFNSMGKVREHSFKNITFDKTYGKGYQMYAIRLPYSFVGFNKIIFEGMDFANTGNYPIYSTGCRYTLKDSTFGTTASWKSLNYAMAPVANKKTVRAYDYNDSPPFGQTFDFLDGCTFENKTSKNCLLVQYETVVLVKDCEWQTDANDSIQAAYGGEVMMWTGNTFTGGREYYDVDYDGRIQWVYGLELTINDEEGDPLEGATIRIEQSEGKEKYVFTTGSDGKIMNDQGLDVALLANIHQYGNSKTTNIEYWSDDSNSTYHNVTIFKEGYRPHETSYVMDEDTSDTIQLKKIDAHASTF